MPASKQNRPLADIATEIIGDWPKANNRDHPAGAYLLPMLEIGSITEMYFADSADSIVRYFLSNASSWHGPVARRIKAELKAML